jgi:threonine/homoserine/homoserine lactone efflux protein
MVEALLSMVVLAIATTFTPGPSTLLAAASGARFGVRSTIPLMAGVAVGLASLMVAAAAGLMVLLQAVPSIHIVVKVLGSAYLLWLCWRISRIMPAGDESGLLKSPVGFGAGMAVLLANPKAWSMAIAASATYAELVPNATQLALMLGAVFAVVAILATLFWCAGGVMLGSTLRSARQWRTVNLILAGLTALSIIPLWL